MSQLTSQQMTSLLQVCKVQKFRHSIRESFTQTADSDYEAISTTLTFLPGDVEITVPIAILEDVVTEQQEEFSMTFYALSEGVAIGKGDTATVIIIDKPGKYVYIKTAIGD